MIMKKTKVTAFMLVFALVVGFAPVTKGSAKSKAFNNIKVKNATAFDGMDIGNTLKIEVKASFVKGIKQKERKALQKYTYSSNNTDVATVSKQGVVTAKAPGKAKITVTTKSKKYKKASVKLAVEVESDYDMLFKYSDLYFILPEGTSSSTVKPGDADEQGHQYDIKTQNFTAKMNDFVFASENSSVVDVDANGVLTLKGYGESEVSAYYKDDEDAAHEVTIHVMTQSEFEQAQANGDLSNEPENSFEEEVDSDDVPSDTDDDEEPEDA